MTTYVVPQRRKPNKNPRRHIGYYGIVTTAAIIISTNEALQKFAKIYNASDKKQLFDDHPYMVAAMGVNEINEFEKNAPTNKELDGARQTALRSRLRIGYGKNYVLETLLKKNVFKELPSEYKLLCQILVPSCRKFPNIDIAFPTEKTEAFDQYLGSSCNPLVNTSVRCLREEMGIKFDQCKNDIMSVRYQTGIRNEYGLEKLPTSVIFSQIKCHIIVVHPEDLDASIN